MRTGTLVFGLIAATLGLTLAQPQTPKVGPEALLNVDARQAMSIANAWGVAGIGAKVTSFVTTEAVQFKFENGQTARVTLPKDRVVIAVAPYLTFTHPCNTHYMSGCRAELANTPIKVLVRTPDGRVVMNDTVRALGNGFVELWLPRDLALELTVEARGKKATGLISTFDGSDTCITTLKLQ
jgi:hypothetical protein